MISPGVKISDDGSTAFLSAASVIISLPEIGAKESKFYWEPENRQKDWAFWGPTDTRPQDILKAVEKNVVASSGLEWLINAFYGGGLVTYKKEIVKGKELLHRENFTEFEDFKEENFFDETLEQFITDAMFFGWKVPEFYLGQGKYSSKIVKVNALDVSFSRWGKMQPGRRSINQLFYSAQFPTAKDHQIDHSPVFDYAKPFTNRKFVHRSRYVGPGRLYYPKRAWHSIIDSGWMAISNNIPGVKQSLLKNAMAIKYHIRIPKTYWKDQVKNWDKLTTEDQKKARMAKMHEMNDFLTGSDNVMKTFFSHFAVDRTGKEIPGWEIIKIDNSIPDGTLTIDQAEANAMILFALNLDPTLKGAGLPNTKQSAGSGSDKREAKEIFTSNLGLQRRRFLDWLYFLRKFNGWNRDIEFGFKDTLLTTLDKNPTGTEKTITE
ncbi:MAG: hypothetical protein QM504_10925 [Pseudomonadota bacterium]